jgi:deferrochelatase/peroxidase EfeB
MSLNRRAFFGLAGAAGVGALVATPSTLAISDQVRKQSLGSAIAFYGDHQAGIASPLQDHLQLVVFKVTTTNKSELQRLLQQWTRAAERMASGKDAGAIGAVAGSPDSPPDDTGEALDLPAARLTITAGFGQSIFNNRFGFAAKRPTAFVDLPKFANDQLHPEKNGGDIILQICADDEQVAFHAMRNLVRIGKGVVVPQWTQSGFSGSTASLGISHTPRNLFGFKDGTSNINLGDNSELSQHVWANGDDWLAGGSYLAVRLTRMNIETWDRSALREQEQVFGRNKGQGAPLSGGSEMSQPNFDKKNTDGSTAIAKDSHMALAHSSKHGGAKMLRRPYSFANGIDEVGQINAGLVFLSFQRDLEKHFIPIQRALSGNDRMNEYVKVIGSGAFACPPGLKPGQYWGHQLFA